MINSYDNEQTDHRWDSSRIAPDFASWQAYENLLQGLRRVTQWELQQQQTNTVCNAITTDTNPSGNTVLPTYQCCQLLRFPIGKED